MIYLFFWTGGGTNSKAINYKTVVEPKSIQAGDINNDSIIDIIAGSNTINSISVYLNNGDGTFQNEKLYLAGLEIHDIAIADFNNDVFLDWCVISEFINRMDCYRASSTTEFTFISSYRFIEGARPRTMSVGDFNGDMLPDIAVANYGTNNFSIFLNSGDGYFQLESYYYVGKNIWTLVVSDFNNDGKSDIAISATLSQPLPRI